MNDLSIIQITKNIKDSSRLSDLTEYFNELLSTVNKVKSVEQRMFQVINESMQMKSVSKTQFGQLNDKRFYFANGLVSLPYSHPSLEELRKEKHKYRDIHKVIQTKKDDFLLKESKILASIPRLNILGQIFAQRPTLYELTSDTKFISVGIQRRETTKELIKSGSWK